MPVAYRLIVKSCVIFFNISRNRNVAQNDAVKQTIEAVTEIRVKSRIPMKSGWLHAKRVLLHEKLLNHEKNLKKYEVR